MPKDLDIPKHKGLKEGWYEKRGIRTYSVMCNCQGIHFLIAEKGVRCYKCREFYDHKYYKILCQNARDASKKKKGSEVYLPRYEVKTKKVVPGKLDPKKIVRKSDLIKLSKQNARVSRPIQQRPTELPTDLNPIINDEKEDNS